MFEFIGCLRYIVMFPRKLPLEFSKISSEKSVLFPKYFSFKQRVQHNRWNIHLEDNPAGEGGIGTDGEDGLVPHVLVKQIKLPWSAVGIFSGQPQLERDILWIPGMGFHHEPSCPNGLLAQFHQFHIVGFQTFRPERLFQKKKIRVFFRALIIKDIIEQRPQFLIFPFDFGKPAVDKPILSHRQAGLVQEYAFHFVPDLLPLRMAVDGRPVLPEIIDDIGRKTVLIAHKLTGQCVILARQHP